MLATVGLHMILLDDTTLQLPACESWTAAAPAEWHAVFLAVISRRLGAQ